MLLPRWDVSEIDNWETVCWNLRGNGYDMDLITTLLILYSEQTGIPRISPKTIKEFNFRVHALHAAGFQLIQRDDEAFFLFTWDELERHMGLATLSAPKTYTPFKAQIRRLVWDQFWSSKLQPLELLRELTSEEFVECKGTGFLARVERELEHEHLKQTGQLRYSELRLHIQPTAPRPVCSSSELHQVLRDMRQSSD